VIWISCQRSFLSHYPLGETSILTFPASDLFYVLQLQRRTVENKFQYRSLSNAQTHFTTQKGTHHLYFIGLSLPIFHQIVVIFHSRICLNLRCERNDLTYRHRTVYTHSRDTQPILRLLAITEIFQSSLQHGKISDLFGIRLFAPTS
jgi:hypothetical protein